jgi:hypothetical protein
LSIINGGFGAGCGENLADVISWYDNSTAGFWEDAWQTNASWITPNGTTVVVYCAWDTSDGSYLYQSMETSAGRRSSVTIGFD